MSIPEQSDDSFDFCVLFRVYFTEKGASGKLLRILRKNRRSFRKAPILWQLLKKCSAALMCNPLQQRNANGGKHNTFRTESSLQTVKEFEKAFFSDKLPMHKKTPFRTIQKNIRLGIDSLPKSRAFQTAATLGLKGFSFSHRNLTIAYN